MKKKKEMYNIINTETGEIRRVAVIQSYQYVPYERYLVVSSEKVKNKLDKMGKWRIAPPTPYFPFAKFTLEKFRVKKSIRLI